MKVKLSQAGAAVAMLLLLSCGPDSATGTDSEGTTDGLAGVSSAAPETEAELEPDDPVVVIQTCAEEVCTGILDSTEMSVCTLKTVLQGTLSYVTYPIINTDGDPGSVYLLIRDSETVSFVTEQFGYGDPDRRYLSIADCAVDVAWVEGILEMCENLEPGFACFPELQVTVSDMACDIRTSFSCAP